MEPDPERGNEYDDVMGMPDDEQPADEVEAENQQADLADLFGDDEPAPEPGEEHFTTDANMSMAAPLPEDEQPPAAATVPYPDDFMEYPDEQVPLSPSQQAMAVPQTEAEIMLVNLPQPAPSARGHLYHVKLPTYLRIESSHFDEDTFSPEAEEAAGPVPVESVLRWRWHQLDAASPILKQSNARIVTWSDGSQSLQVGAELFDVVLQPATQSTSSGSTYLAASHDYATLMETQARIDGHMTFVPSAVGSSTHKKLASNVSQRHVKTQRTQTIAIAKDPMAQLAEDEAAEQAKQRDAKKKRRKSQPRQRSESFSADEGPSGYARPGRGSRYAYDSDEEDEEGFVIEDEDEAGAGEDDLDMADQAAERTTKNRRREVNYDDEDDDEEDEAPAAPAEPAKIDKKRMVVEGSDEE